MTNPTTPAPAPDFGEPWSIDPESGIINDRSGAWTGNNVQRARAVECLNALAGIRNPAAVVDVVKALEAQSSWADQLLKMRDHKLSKLKG